MGRALDAHAYQVFLFGSRFPEDCNGTERLGIHPGHQIGVPGFIFLPKLAYLNFSRAHVLGKDCRYPTPHCQLFLMESPVRHGKGNLLPQSYILNKDDFGVVWGVYSR